MIISINEMSEIPIYQQIRNQIVQGISDGRLSPGEQLPTVRGLAEEIGINSMTRICGDERAFGEIKGIVAADHLGSESQRHDEGRIF